MQETWVWALGWEDPLEKEMAIYSSTIAWKIPWTEEPGRLQSMGLQRVGHDWATSLITHVFICLSSYPAWPKCKKIGWNQENSLCMSSVTQIYWIVSIFVLFTYVSCQMLRLHRLWSNKNFFTVHSSDNEMTWSPKRGRRPEDASFLICVNIYFIYSP